MGMDAVLSLVAMLTVELSLAVNAILSKVAFEQGMDPSILVAYRMIVGTFVTAPLSLYLERHMIPQITKKIMIKIFVLSIFGATGNVLLFFLGIKHTTPTIGTALENTVPALTFLLAIPFGLETLGMRKRWGQAKIVGTVVSIGGAMFLCFYHGHVIGIGRSKLRWNYAVTMKKELASATSSSLLGAGLVLGGNICWSIWFILQAKMGQSFYAPYMTTTLMCFMSSFQCTFIAILFNHEMSAWSLLPSIRLTATLVSGAIGSGLSWCLLAWVIQMKGPLYASVFGPFLLVITAFLSWALLEDNLYIGTVVGSVLIVMGLYVFLWGKNKEAEDKSNKQVKDKSKKEVKDKSNKEGDMV